MQTLNFCFKPKPERILEYVKKKYSRMLGDKMSTGRDCVFKVFKVYLDNVIM